MAHIAHLDFFVDFWWENENILISSFKTGLNKMNQNENDAKSNNIKIPKIDQNDMFCLLEYFLAGCLAKVQG